jgi:hypothetical protein
MIILFECKLTLLKMVIIKFVSRFDAIEEITIICYRHTAIRMGLR